MANKPFPPSSKRSEPVPPAVVLPRRALPHHQAGHQLVRLPRAVRAGSAAGVRLGRRHLRQRVRDAARGLQGREGGGRGGGGAHAGVGDRGQSAVHRKLW